MKHIYVLRVNDAKNQSRNGFQYPLKGKVSAPDWNPSPHCGEGLHGWENGEGDPSVANAYPDGVWLVLKVEDRPDNLVRIDGKVKFREGIVVFSGSRNAVTEYIYKKTKAPSVLWVNLTGGYSSTLTGGHSSTLTGGHSSTLTGGYSSTLTGGDSSTLTGGHSSTLTGGHSSTLTGGDYSTLTGGDYSTLTGRYSSTLTGGHSSTLTGGYSSTLTGGDSSTLTGVDYSTLTGGDYSTLTGGYSSTLTGGHSSTLTGGDSSTLTGGYSSTLTGGDYSTLTWRVFDGFRYRLHTFYTGEAGIKANTPYRFTDGKIEEVTP